MAESKEELRNLLIKAKEKSDKTDLKLNIQNMKIMASSLITSWEIDEETMKVADFNFLVSKILQILTAAMKLKCACSLEEKIWQI